MANNKAVHINQKLSILIIVSLIISISSILTFSIAVLVMQVMFGLFMVLIMLSKEYKKLKKYILILIISIIFVFFVYNANLSYYGQPYYTGGSDDLKFENWGLDIYHSNIYMPHKIMKLGIAGQFHNSPEEWLFPVVEKLQEELLKDKYLHADETPVQVLNEEGKKNTTKSYMRAYSTSTNAKHGIRIFKYASCRSGDNAKEFLEGFKGYLHSDGYSGYEKS